MRVVDGGVVGEMDGHVQKTGRRHFSTNASGSWSGPVLMKITNQSRTQTHL